MQKLSKYEKFLLGIFLLTLPFVNPWVRGDGVGYYAFGRALLIEHRLDFRPDWLHANASFQMGRIDPTGAIRPDQFTVTGHLINHFAVGPAILWAPFLIVAHAGVLVADQLGAHVAADGFSWPYTVAMALGTLFYGFGALWISFRTARKYVQERWAFLATLGIWFASSLPVYMYFNPSWAHAHSAFMVALFLWYWLRTVNSRTLAQWVLLGALGGLMMDVYYINAVVLVLPFAEFLYLCYSRLKSRLLGGAMPVVYRGLAFALAAMTAFLPTLISKKIVYGSFLDFGYGVPWSWLSPAFFKVAFSSDHGVFTWTPILIFAVMGLVFLSSAPRYLALALGSVFLLYLYAIGCYGDWDGLSSFGNRFFVSLTPVFVIGLAALFNRFDSVWKGSNATRAIAAATAVFVAINFGLIFQWGTHLIPSRGPISWRTAAYNQVAVVPRMAADTVGRYLTGRSQLMSHIEEADVRQLRASQAEAAP